MRMSVTNTAVRESANEQKYLVIAATDGAGFFTTPRVIKAENYNDEVYKAQRATDGNCGMAILSRFSVPVDPPSADAPRSEVAVQGEPVSA
jgi:hypothetical protein